MKSCIWQDRAAQRSLIKPDSNKLNYFLTFVFLNLTIAKHRMTVLFYVALIVAAFLSSLVAGFLFAFAVVAMPGIKNLNDNAFIRAFQVMDRVIQDNQPIFMLVWIGSVIALIIAAVLGTGQLEGIERVLLLSATFIYLFGVQLPTVTINIPLNNQIQSVDVDAIDETAQKTARSGFEPRWNRWNTIRTIFSCLASFLLIILLTRI